jgi:uncharacterized protein
MRKYLSQHHIHITLFVLIKCCFIGILFVRLAAFKVNPMQHAFRSIKFDIKRSRRRHHPFCSCTSVSSSAFYLSEEKWITGNHLVAWKLRNVPDHSLSYEMNPQAIRDGSILREHFRSALMSNRTVTFCESVQLKRLKEQSSHRSVVVTNMMTTEQTTPIGDPNALQINENVLGYERTNGCGCTSCVAIYDLTTLHLPPIISEFLELLTFNLATLTHLQKVEDERHSNTTEQDVGNKIGVSKGTQRASVAMIVLIGLYKQYISPLMPPACRFVPTCSSYGIQSIEEFGPSRGAILTAWRLLRCSPMGGKGYDPPRWPPVPYTYGR